MTTGRNEKCPCGSGKKYKHCCLQKDIEAEREKRELAEVGEGDVPFEENPEPKFATWKIFVIVTAALGIISLLLAYVFDFPRVAGALFGVGMIILIVFSAFRNEPTVRKRPGDAGNIDFGNRA